MKMKTITHPKRIPPLRRHRSRGMLAAFALPLLLLLAAPAPLLAQEEEEEEEEDASKEEPKRKKGRKRRPSPGIRSRLAPARITPRAPSGKPLAPGLGGAKKLAPAAGKVKRAGKAATPAPEASERKPSTQKRKKRDFRRARKQNYSLDFEKADIGDVIKMVSEMIGQNFILTDKARSAKITIMTPQPVSADEAYRAFLAALAMNKLAVVPYGEYLKIVEEKDARGDAIKIYGSDEELPADDRLVTYILQLKYADVKDIETVIKQIKSREGNTVAYLPMNTLVLNETAHNLRRVLDIVAKLDVPTGAERIHIVEIIYADAADIADTISQLFGEKSKKGKKSRKTSIKTGKSKGKADAGGDEGGEVTVGKVIADDRTNKLLVLSSDRAWVRVRQLIEHLDIPIPGDGQVHVHYLENADATELATVLSNLAQGRVGKKKSKKGQKSKSRAGSSAELFEGEVKVTSDKATNSLVIVASAKDYASLKRVIDKLDIRRRQVFVEATILEVSLKKDNKAGVAWNGGHVFDVAGEEIPLFFGTNLSGLSSLAIDPTVLTGIAAGLRGPDLEGSEGLIPGLSGPLPSFGAIMIALQENSDVNVLSSPHILTTDNEEATITVGKNVPFVMGFTGYGGGASSRTGGYYSNPVVSIQRQDVALTLKLTPQINESDYIRLKVEQEITELTKGGDVRTGPITNKRTAKTTVVMKDQQTVVIGGLMQDKSSEGISKVPFLGDIPLLGWLFRYSDNTKEKTNLLLFLTPYIIKDPGDFRKIFKRKMAERKEFVDRFFGDAKEIKIAIDYTRKIGPLGDVHRTLDAQRKEKQQRDMEQEELQQDIPRVQILGVEGETYGEDGELIEPATGEPIAPAVGEPVLIEAPEPPEPDEANPKPPAEAGAEE